MVTDAEIVAEFKRDVADEVELIPSGADRFGVVTPLAFDDGDLLPIVLRRVDGGWRLTDEGHTFLQLTYELEEADFEQPTRREIISKTLTTFGVLNLNGVLVLPIQNNNFGDALYTFIQALVKIDDIRYLSREHARSTFLDELRPMVRRVTPQSKEVVYNWYEPKHDPSGNYPVHCKVNGSGEPLLVFALPNDARVAIAALTLHMFNRWGIANRSIGIFEDQTKLDSKMVARLTDVVNKPFSNLAIAKEEIARFFPELRGQT